MLIFRPFFIKIIFVYSSININCNFKKRRIGHKVIFVRYINQYNLRRISDFYKSLIKILIKAGSRQILWKLPNIISRNIQNLNSLICYSFYLVQNFGYIDLLLGYFTFLYRYNHYISFT